MDRSQLKAMSREQIRGKIGILFVIALIMSGITAVINGLLPDYTVPNQSAEGYNLTIDFFALPVAILVTSAFTLSNARIYLGITEGRTPVIEDTFYGFKDYVSAVLVTLLQTVYTFLWTLLFIVPGIIKSISYSMAQYILAENKGMSASDAINESKRIMNGHKMDCFILSLSFLGWILLGILTLGILYIWLIPYMNTTMANFYKSIKPVIPTLEIPEEPTSEPGTTDSTGSDTIVL